MKLSYAIIGIGSVGSMIAYYLNCSGIEPYLVFKDDNSIREIYVVDKVSGRKSILKGIATSIDSDIWINADVVIIAVKAYSIKNILDHLERLSKETVFITIQNGFGTYESLHNKYGERVFNIVINHGAYPLNYREYMLIGGGKSYIGPLRIEYRELFSSILNDLSRLNLEPVIDIEPYRWLKAIINSVINPLTLITKSRNRSILDDTLIYISSLIIEELKLLAKRVGIELPLDPYQELVKIAHSTGENYSSMLIDLKKCRDTELDHLNGYFIKLASRYGLDLKVNKIVYNLARYIHYSECFEREKDNTL